MLNSTIRTLEDLRENMPEIHRIIESKSNDPCMPILTERDLETELTMQQHEFFMENGSIDHFPGMTSQSITDTIMNIHLKYQVIADIDGRGTLENPRPVKEAIQQPSAPITDYLLDSERINL